MKNIKMVVKDINNDCAKTIESLFNCSDIECAIIVCARHYFGVGITNEEVGGIKNQIITKEYLTAESQLQIVVNNIPIFFMRKGLEQYINFHKNYYEFMKNKI